MILRIFKKSYLPQYLSLLFIQAALWVGAFISPIEMRPPANEYLTPAYTLLFNIFNGHLFLSTLFAFFIILSTSLTFNFILDKHELIVKNSLIGGLIFIVILSSVGSLLTIYQAIVPSLLLTIILHYVFSIYSEEEAYLKVFNSGFLIAICSFFYFPSIFLLIFLWLTFFSYRIYKWREWVITILGFITPYILIWTYYFWIDSIEFVMNAYLEYFATISLVNLNLDFSVLDYIISLMILLLFLRAFFRISTNLQENVINVRKRFWASVMFLIVTILGFIFSGTNPEQNLIFVYLSFGITISGFAFTLRKYFWTELYVSVLIILILINNLLSSLEII